MVALIIIYRSKALADSFQSEPRELDIKNIIVYFLFSLDEKS